MIACCVSVLSKSLPRKQTIIVNTILYTMSCSLLHILSQDENSTLLLMISIVYQESIYERSPYKTGNKRKYFAVESQEKLFFSAHSFTRRGLDPTVNDFVRAPGKYF
jgi:hypothetical protein